ncbi:MAG TPA: hypothetical protein VFV50_04815 [Bdellovibrionales bacterium]|nr:hypothetical protein [Bdellovibrionales bacterium]
MRKLCWVLGLLNLTFTLMISSKTAAEELDTYLGESYEGQSAQAEKFLIQKLAKISVDSLKKKYPEHLAAAEPVPRDVHGKSHGCVFGSFMVRNESLPSYLRVGLFEENREYKTILRYSSNNQDPHYEDARGDIRGLGIKVLNAKGLTGVSQDFLFLGIDTVFLPNNTFYVEFLERLLRENQLKVGLWFAANHPRLAYTMLKGFMDVGRYFNPKDIPFFSAVAFRLGERTLKNGTENFNRRAVKYKLQEVACNSGARPVRTPKKDTNVRDPDYLKENFTKSLAESEICLSFSILIRDPKDKELYPVEDGTIPWGGEYRPVADIRLHQQRFDTQERRAFCENLRFTPWNTLPEHRPLGRINRARKEIYEAVSTYRNQRNGITEYREPVDF